MCIIIMIGIIDQIDSSSIFSEGRAGLAGLSVHAHFSIAYNTKPAIILATTSVTGCQVGYHWHIISLMDIRQMDVSLSMHACSVKMNSPSSMCRVPLYGRQGTPGKFLSPCRDIFPLSMAIK